MKMLKLALPLLLAGSAWASYQYYLTDNLSVYNPALWNLAGFLSVGPGASGSDPPVDP